MLGFQPFRVECQLAGIITGTTPSTRTSPRG
jgi:hypothetical protein